MESSDSKPTGRSTRRTTRPSSYQPWNGPSPTDTTIRIVLVFPTFGGVSAGAGWQDLKLGVEHLTHWKKVALVTDVEWMIQLVRLFGWMTPGELRHFPLDERDAATAWAAAD